MSRARPLASAHPDDAGQALVLIAASLAGLLLGVGLAVDTGQLYVARRQVQNVADAAAWAGAVVLYNNGGAAAAETAAIADAALNGYALLPAEVDSPPLTGPTAGDASFIEVRMTQQVRTFFFPGPRPVSVRSAAGSARSGTGEGVLVLRTGAVADTLNLVDSSRLSVTGAGIHVNSTHAGAVNIATGTITAAYTRIVGGLAAGDDAKVLPNPPGATEGYPGGAAADPFLNLPTPPVVGPTFNNLATIVAPTTLVPGVYNGGIRIDTGGVVTMTPGVYIIKPGSVNQYGFNVRNGGDVLMQGATGGVLLFFTHANYPGAPGGSPVCNVLDLNGQAANGSSVTLSAQRTGTYAGMVVYQDRNCPTTTPTSEIRSDGAKSVSGTIYQPSSRLTVRGGTTMDFNAQLVVRELRLENNNTRLNLTFDPGSVFGSRAPALTE